MNIGPFVRRKHKAMANAADWLEPGEQVRHGVMVNMGGGTPAGGPTVTELVGQIEPSHASYPGVFLLALTDRNIRVFSLSGWSGLTGSPFQVPLAGARIELKKVAGGLMGPAVVVNGRRFETVPFHKNRRDARRLVQAAASR